MLDRDQIDNWRDDGDEIARAKEVLLRHNIDWNAYEVNMRTRYRPPTSEDLDEYLADNPHMKMVGTIHVDPDTPLTSELQYDRK